MLNVKNNETNDNNELIELSIVKLITEDKYLIPSYQRNFAWGEPEIKQLIRDIADYAIKDQNYYIGTLIVDEKTKDYDSYYEVIDGQQRFTTLHLLCSYLKNEKETGILSEYKSVNIDFFSRPKSKQTLDKVFKNECEKIADEKNQAIIDGYKTIKKSFDNILHEANIKVADFTEYLLEKVIILRVQVPEDTDLNHYFEVMNNRGEQLEKHEIIKSRMLSTLNDKIESPNEKAKAISTFQNIWEACSNMDRYIQYGFKTDIKNKENDFRKVIFGENWNSFEFKIFDDVTDKLFQSQSLSNKDSIIKNITLSEVISEQNSTAFISKENIEDESQRFESVINFQNFLLQVLRILVNTKYKERIQKYKDVNKSNEKDKVDINISLDDKQLIKEFNVILKIFEKEEQVQFVKDFGFYLLKLRFLFDKYIIKRELKAGTEDWSLQTLKKRDKENQGTYSNTFDKEEENRELLMLLSMFHVSAPTQNYKHWLTGALKYVFENEIVITEDYTMYLVELANAFLFDRFLAEEQEEDYYDIIFNNSGKSHNRNIKVEKLNKGTKVENFVFNYLDYLLWKKDDKSIYSKFKFSFRSSVEHHYPQNPPEGKNELGKDIIDKFGNLSLMSREKNSTFTNNMPESKSKNFTIDEVYDSIKMRIMFEKSKDKWDESEIEEHGKMMIEILTDKLF